MALKKIVQLSTPAFLVLMLSACGGGSSEANLTTVTVDKNNTSNTGIASKFKMTINAKAQACNYQEALPNAEVLLHRADGSYIKSYLSNSSGVVEGDWPVDAQTVSIATKIWESPSTPGLQLSTYLNVKPDYFNTHTITASTLNSKCLKKTLYFKTDFLELYKKFGEYGINLGRREKVDDDTYKKVFYTSPNSKFQAIQIVITSPTSTTPWVAEIDLENTPDESQIQLSADTFKALGRYLKPRADFTYDNMYITKLYDANLGNSTANYDVGFKADNKQLTPVYTLNSEDYLAAAEYVKTVSNNLYFTRELVGRYNYNTDPDFSDIGNHEKLLSIYQGLPNTDNLNYNFDLNGTPFQGLQINTRGQNSKNVWINYSVYAPLTGQMPNLRYSDYYQQQLSKANASFTYSLFFLANANATNFADWMKSEINKTPNLFPKQYKYQALGIQGLSPSNKLFQ